MLPVSGKCRRAAACLQGFEHGVDFRLAEYALQRVLEFEAALVELLRPLGLFFAAKNPAAHVLRFQHEDAIGREKNVVDLRGAVWGIQGDVVQAAVDLLIQLPMCE